MTMDVVLVGFLAGFVFGGWRTGFLRRLLGIVFIVVAAVAGAWFRYPVGAIAARLFPEIPADYANLVGYAIAFPVILVSLHVIQAKVIGKVAVRGITRELDGALGAAMGFLEAVMILSVVVVIVDTYFGTKAVIPVDVAPGLLREFTTAFNASETVKLLHQTTVPLTLAILGPVLPRDLSVLHPDGLPNRLPFPVRLP